MSKCRTGKIERKGSNRAPKVRFALFCEGRNTEPAYFKAIKKVCTGALVSVESRRGAGTPITIAQSSLKFAKEEGLIQGSRRSRNSFEERDEVWAVFDRDEHGRYDEAVQICESAGIGVARSNPCFEVWLILHEQDYNRPDDRREVQKKFETLRPEYEVAGAKVPDCEEMVTRVQDAEMRSEKLLRHREEEGDPRGRPSTTVGKLTKAIRDANFRAGR